MIKAIDGCRSEIEHSEEPDKLYELLYKRHQLLQRGHDYYCWESQRIRNQYLNLGMIETYNQTLAKVRLDLEREKERAKRIRKGAG